LKFSNFFKKDFIFLLLYVLKDLKKRGLLNLLLFLYNYIFLLISINSKVNKLRVLYPSAPGEINETKYSNTEFWVFESLYRAFKLNLNTTSSLKILDIGSGAGYFIHICNFLGHSASGIDIPSNKLYNNFNKELFNHRFLFKIKSFKSLQLKGRYDLITAFMVCFNNHKKSNQWGTKEWNFFLNDLKVNHLKAHGIIYIEFNSESISELIPQDLKNNFLKRGAIVDACKVKILSDKYFFK
jgi:hypothetical protein